MSATFLSASSELTTQTRKCEACSCSRRMDCLRMSLILFGSGPSLRGPPRPEGCATFGDTCAELIEWPVSAATQVFRLRLMRSLLLLKLLLTPPDTALLILLLFICSQRNCHSEPLTPRLRQTRTSAREQKFGLRFAVKSQIYCTWAHRKVVASKRFARPEVGPGSAFFLPPVLFHASC